MMADEVNELREQLESLQYRYDKYRETAVSRVRELETEVAELKRQIEDK